MDATETMRQARFGHQRTADGMGEWLKMITGDAGVLIADIYASVGGDSVTPFGLAEKIAEKWNSLPSKPGPEGDAWNKAVLSIIMYYGFNRAAELVAGKAAKLLGQPRSNAMECRCEKNRQLTGFYRCPFCGRAYWKGVRYPEADTLHEPPVIIWCNTEQCDEK